MKIQGLAIIFVIIILPITIILGEYASAQIKIFRMEQMYDSRLITATHDALKAFQLNTFNDATSDIADSKLSSIEASANAFYNSMESSFGLEGYSKEDLQMYVPAIVYTMYDGYYIYSPYTNVADISQGSELNIELNSNEIQYGFKPYVYYSCRYVMGSNYDFIINYSLDNYITVQGLVDGESVYKSGYLLTIANSRLDVGVYKESLVEGYIKYYYNGIEIKPENNLSEYLVETDSQGNIITREYKYVKLNGTKYYLNEKDDDGDGKIDEYIFYLLGGNRVKQAIKEQNLSLYNEYIEQIQINSNAVNYYESAYEFTTWINQKLSGLRASHAQSNIQDRSDYKIFENSKIEYSTSNFHKHRKDVIRFSVESNLSVAIVNFNGYTNSGTNFQMPKLKETEWDLLQNEISIISFLQGLNLGGKIYNGYTVVTNSKTEEVVKEERIYMTTNDGYYHKINDNHFSERDFDVSTVKLGALDLDFETRKDGATGASYVHKDEIGCYTSIISQENVNNRYESIYEYLEKEDKVDKKIKDKYYTALGRERWSTYKTENYSTINKILDDMEPENEYDKVMVTDGLIRHLEANNADGYGNKLSSEVTIWRDLSDHYDGKVNGTPLATENCVEFDGVDDWIDLGKIEEDYLTLETVVEFSDEFSYEGDHYILTNHETGGIGIMLRNNKIVASAYINGAYREITNNMPIKYNIKYNISTTFDGQILKLYIYADGNFTEQEKIIPGGGVIQNPKNDTIMAIGVNPHNETPSSAYGYMNMKVHSIRIYNRALDREEIEKNYNFGNMVQITNITMDPIQGVWSNSGIIIDVTARTYNSAGISKVLYTTDLSEVWQESKWSESNKTQYGKVINVKGTWIQQYKELTLYLKAVDNSGFESDIETVVLNNDSMKPEILDIQREHDKVTVTLEDPWEEAQYSGIERIEYSFDNNTWETDKWDESTLTITDNKMEITGTWDPEVHNNKILYVRAIDHAGNISEVKSIEIVAPAYIDINYVVNGTRNNYRT